MIDSDDYDDDDVCETSFYGNKKSYNGKKTKLTKNPAGPYSLEMVFQGIKFNVIIENLSIDEFEITISSNKKANTDKIESLKKYLDVEGFENAARKHNLFWQ